MSEKPKVYVVAQWKWNTGDVGGILMHADGTVTAQHMSSDISWLRRDLTDGFKDRREALEQRYPDGYEVVVVDLYEQDPPPEIARFFSEEVASD